MKNLSTIIIETNSLNKKTWASIYSLIELIESKKHNSLKIKNDISIYYLEKSKSKRRIRLPIGIRITETNLGILDSGIKDYLIIYNHNNSKRNFQEFLPFFNLIDIYHKRISLGININEITKAEREEYHLTISQYLMQYRENKNIRDDEQIYFIYCFEKTNKDTGEITKYKTAKIALKSQLSENVSKRFSILFRITKETFYEFFSFTSGQIKKNKSKCAYILEAIKKYDEYFNKRLSNKKEGEIFNKNIKSINTWLYKNIFSEYLIKSLFFHLLEESKEEFNSINSINKLFYLLEKYTDGIEELIENIIYHTNKKIGYFYLEFIKKENINDKKFTETINKINNVSRILKICIYDFSNEGILDTFKEKITLEDLYNPKKIIEKDTHLDLRYAAHTGLKVFQKNIINNFGTFTLETNYSKPGSKIKYELIHNDPEPKIDEPYNNCISGTHYEIFLPISENLIKHLPTENYITYQSQPFNYTTWLKKANKISCIDLTNYLPEIESQQSNKIELIKDVGNKILKDYENLNSLAIDYKSMGIFKNISFFFKFLSYLQLRTTYYFQLIIISNITKGFLDNIKKKIEDLIDTNQKIWNNHTALVLITEKTFNPYIVTGETPSKITAINNLLRNYYPSINYFDFNIEKDDNEVINSSNKFIQPYELIVYKENNNIFENYLSNILENEIEKDKIGYKLRVKNVLLGSKIITENFYEADTLFQNSFFVDRFAFLITKQIVEKKLDKIVLIGYGLYSEFLLNTIKSFIEKFHKDIIKAVIIAKNIEKDDWILRGISQSELNTKFSEYSFISIVPIGSTLSTNDKLISKFIQLIGAHNIDNSNIVNKFTNISVVLVRDKCEKKITEKESIYWESIQDKTISTKFTFASKVSFLIGKSGHWNSIFNNNVSFPQYFLEEKPVLRTKHLSINSYRTIGWPRVKGIDNKTFELELERLKTFKDYTLIHHFDWNKSHLHYYFDTETYINKEKNSIEKWIKKIGERINKKFSGLNVIITPNNNIESSFVKLVNKELFNSNAFIIYMDIYNDIRNNIIHKYSFLKEIERKDQDSKLTIFKVKFHFIDHVLSTGSSARKARSYISSIMDENRPFESIITLINRLSYYRNNEIVGYQKETTKRTKVFEYINLFIPPIKTPEKDCSICTSIKLYEILKTHTSIKSLYDFLDKKITRLETTKLNFSENSKNKVRANKRNFERFLLTHKIFYKISSFLTGNKVESHINIEKHLEALGNNNSISFKINFVKVLSTQPLINYQHIKTFVFQYMLNELEDLLSSKTYNIFSFNYLIILLKHLSGLEANALIRKELITKVWEYYFDFLKNKETEILSIHNKISVNTSKISSFIESINKLNNSPLFNQQELNKLSKQKEKCKKDRDKLEEEKDVWKSEKTESNIENFNILFHLFVNNVTYNDEAKSLWLGELLRTGEENQNFFKSNYNLSRTEENNTLFNYFKNKEIDNSLLSKYKNFLVWIKYDNNVILRKTLQRLEEELQRNIKLRKYFFKEQTEILLPLTDLSIDDINIELRNIIESEYYHQYIHKYLILDSPPVLEKLIYILYARLLFKEFNQEQYTKELPEKMLDILKVFSKIMDANAAFMVLRKPNEDNKYRIIKSFNIDINKDPYLNFNKHFNTSDYSYTYYQLNKKENFYPIVSNNILEKTSGSVKIIYGEKEDLKFKAINVLRIYNSYSNNENNKKPIGAITFLYSENNITDKQSFSTYSKDLSIFLMLLKNDFNNLIKEAYNKHSISEIINKVNNQEKFDRIYVHTDHRFGSNTRESIKKIYEIANTNKDLLGKLIYPFITFSDNTISWLYSKVEKHSGDLKQVGSIKLKEDTTFLSVFNKEYMEFLDYISNQNFEPWSGFLEIKGFDIKNDFDIEWDVEILRSFIILLIKNSMYTHISLSKKTITLTFSPEDKTIKIIDNIPNKEKEEIKDFQKKKKEFSRNKSSIFNLNLENYSCTTLTSLVAYCKYLNLPIDIDYNTDDNFYVKFKII